MKKHQGIFPIFENRLRLLSIRVISGIFCAAASWASMRDSLYGDRSFWTLNLFDEGTREALAIEVDASWPAARVIRVLGQQTQTNTKPLRTLKALI